jgi:hypothetical protein
MSLYLDRLVRVCPPRSGATYGSGAARVVACNVNTASVELDSDIFRITGAANGSYGRALVEFYADGNDLYLNFGGASTVVANSAATSGSTVAACVPVSKWRFWELDPLVDLWMSARTISGNSLTATLRYRIVSFATRSQP